MRSLGLLLGLVAVIGLATVGSALAADAKGAGMRPTMGEVTKIDGKALTIKTQDADVTATVDDSTEILKMEPVKLADVKVGDNVRITQGDKRFGGEVSKIDGKMLTLKSRRGGDDQTVTVDDSTTILGNVKAKFEDIKVGQRVMAVIKDGKASRVTMVPAGTMGPGGKGRDKAK